MASSARWFLLVLALLVGALSLFAAAPAEAQTRLSEPLNVQVTAGPAELRLTWEEPLSWGNDEEEDRGYEIDWGFDNNGSKPEHENWLQISPDQEDQFPGNTQAFKASVTSYTFTGTHATGNGMFHTVVNPTKYWFRIRTFTIDPKDRSDIIVPRYYVTRSGTPQAQQTQSSDATLSALTASSATSSGDPYSALNIGTFAAATTALHGDGGERTDAREADADGDPLGGDGGRAQGVDGQLRDGDQRQRERGDRARSGVQRDHSASHGPGLDNEGLHGHGHAGCPGKGNPVYGTGGRSAGDCDFN